MRKGNQYWTIPPADATSYDDLTKAMVNRYQALKRDGHITGDPLDILEREINHRIAALVRMESAP